jgi:hypothetical protein
MEECMSRGEVKVEVRDNILLREKGKSYNTKIVI